MRRETMSLRPWGSDLAAFLPQSGLASALQAASYIIIKVSSRAAGVVQGPLVSFHRPKRSIFSAVKRSQPLRRALARHPALRGREAQAQLRLRLITSRGPPGQQRRQNAGANKSLHHLRREGIAPLQPLPPRPVLFGAMPAARLAGAPENVRERVA